MESEFFQDAGIPPLPLPPPPPPNQSLSIPTWPYLPSSIEMLDQGLNFESDLSSLVSSPAASNSNISNENMVMRELICKLGNTGGEISPHSQHVLATSYCTKTGSNSTNTSCYSTPLNSPPKLNLQHVIDQYNKDILNLPGLGKSPIGTELMGDPGFAERAARFSCFGSRSFNGRTNQRLVLKNVELAYNNVMENSNLSRVSSSPSLKALAIGSMRNEGCDRSETSREESTVSQLIPNGGEAGFKASGEMNSRKRKAASKGKGKAKDQLPNFVKDGETNDNSDAKRSKPNQGNGNVSPVKSEEESKGNGDDTNQNKANSKPPEPPKDYIHVRARRGQATDSHSLAERVRREKISERMKLLQDLVPGCNKVTGKALMLDEIINYVQSLQRQVEFLSMKLASVNTRLDVTMDIFTSKDIFQSNHQLPHPIFPLDSSASTVFGHQPLPNPVVHNNILNGTLTQCSVDQLGNGLCHSPTLQLPQLDSFNTSAPQYSTLCEDDLQTIVQMGFRQNPNREMTLQSDNFHGSNHVSHMKVEL